MNTTHRARPKPLELQELPAEIWLDILERACTAGVRNPSNVNNTIEFSLSAKSGRKKLYRQSLVTKRYVVRVCKQWNAWASPYLYEHIHLSKRSHLRSLWSALADTSDFGPESSQPTSRPLKCSWIKQLDIALRANDAQSTLLSVGEEISLTSKFVQCLSNLVIVHFDVCAPQLQCFSAAIFDGLAKSCGPTLQAVTWTSTALPPDPQIWWTFLEKSANLRTLGCPDEVPGLHNPSQHVLLPLLESVRFSRTPPCAELPALRHVVGDAYSLVNPHWTPFLQIHGGKLEIIQLHLGQHCALPPLLALMSSTCSKICRLDLSVPSWSIFVCRVADCKLLLPATVRVLGLQNTAIQAPAQGYRALHTMLKELKLTPSLNVVQLTDCGNVRELRQKHFQMMKNMVHMLKERGLQLRDHEGSLME